MKRVILILLFSFIFFACKESIKDGTIEKMSYLPPHSYSYLTMIPAGKVLIPITHLGYIPDTTFYVQIFKVVNGDTIRREITVTSENYHTFDYGAEITITE